MTSYTYSALPPGSFTHRSGKHLYEALSYTWGSGIKSQSILIDGSLLSVTENLHTALIYLRDHQLERVLWVDAVCINQKDEDEKAKHIPYMRAIYAQADRVMVWLGEPDDNEGNALDTIHRLAEDKVLMLSTSATVLSSGVNYNACLKMFRHDWFRRIWVLQEVGVARCVIFQCGFTQVDGFAICEGLGGLETSFLPEYIFPIVPLVRGAIFRSRSTPKSRVTRSIGELIDMHHSHLATVSHDKIYALLGLCSDDLGTPCLIPNYKGALDEVAKRVITYVFEGKCDVTIAPGTLTAVIKGKGWILGRVISVQKSSYSDINQEIEIQFHKSHVSQTLENQWGNKWRLQASATPIQTNDVVCVMQGSSKPIIIRLSKDRISVVISTVVPRITPERSREELSFEELSDVHPQQVEPTDGTLVDLLVTWDIIETINDKGSEHPHQLAKLSNMALNHPGQAADQEDLRCRQLIMEDIVVDIVSRSEFAVHFEPLKLLLCQTLLKVPVSERLIYAALVEPYEEASVKAVPDCTGLRSLLFYPVNRKTITEAVILKAMSPLEVYPSISFFYEHQRSLQIKKSLIKAALEHVDAPEILRRISLNKRNPSGSESLIKTAIMMPRGYDILRQVFSPLNEGPPITEDLVKYAAGGFVESLSPVQYFTFQGDLPPPENEAQAAKHNEVFYKHSKNLVRLFYNCQKSVVVAATKDPEVGKKINRMVLIGSIRRGRRDDQNPFESSSSDECLKLRRKRNGKERRKLRRAVDKWGPSESILMPTSEVSSSSSLEASSSDLEQQNPFSKVRF
ncbi:HET domain-containing protein [Aspergillus neoniger CBS 115656]|uniref:HET-domain-containing protein n=1 Tax=Aspergillus neoniger (strain CBS 115656) TaxID=1448310 RepID=A0A318ZCR6_ASPNB|nr:HET-domain-containing protein [Aspergillus neoniger CBS 115656]PYH38078.1 HET-domain-containing protein [Aspergillus neoniger CBS 115656]